MELLYLDNLEAKKLINNVKSIFEKAKLAQRDKDGSFVDKEWESKIADAIVTSRKNLLEEFSEEIFPYLKYPCEYIKEQVVYTLGRRFMVPTFKEECYKIFLNNSNYNLARRAALESWIAYFYCTNDKKAIKKLYKILINNNDKFSDLKLAAYYGIFSVCCIPGEKVADLSSTSNIEKINKRIDWDYIHELMQKYSPETPLIDPSQFDPRTPRKVER